MLIGKVVGVYDYFKEIEHPSLKAAILDVVREYKFPILANLDFEHQTVNIPMLIGVQAEVNSTTKSFSILEAAVH